MENTITQCLSADCQDKLSVCCKSKGEFIKDEAGERFVCQECMATFEPMPCLAAIKAMEAMEVKPPQPAAPVEPKAEVLANSEDVEKVHGGAVPVVPEPTPSPKEDVNVGGDAAPLEPKPEAPVAPVAPIDTKKDDTIKPGETKGRYHLQIKMNDKVYETWTDDLKAAIVSFKPVVIKTKVVFTITDGDKVCIRHLFVNRAKMVFRNRITLHVFTKNLIFKPIENGAAN